MPRMHRCRVARTAGHGSPGSAWHWAVRLVIELPPTAAARRTFSYSFSITQCDAVCISWYPAGRGRSRPALNSKAHASAACCSLFRAVRDARDLAKQLRRIPVQVMLGVQTETKTETLK